MTKHVLTIDDEVALLEILSETLTAKGYRVTSAESAHEGLRVAKDDPPQLIISDLQMEDSDGLELIEKLKKMLPTVPIILLTGVVFDTEVVDANISKKVSLYIPKMTSLQKITEAVQRLLGDLNPDGSPPPQGPSPSNL